ncbi:alpha/beta hydrolase family protein [Duganella sp. BJB488]|uniref:alpha/beta hydrolase n=2 Tax=Duganella TaxID=75654 RepID=UPI0018F6B9E8|nr:alpha/beta hydrolase-fold protein [Duganella sp. BJB488]
MTEWQREISNMVNTQYPAGRIVLGTIDSRLLTGNAAGDPARRQLAIYLPPGYDEGAARYPSVYVLAGYGGRGLTLLNDSAWDENLPQRLDRLIGSGHMRPMIVVMPDCLTRYGGSQYINSSATGRYEDYVADEIVAHVDARYRTVAARDWRAVSGKSSGGYGALMFAMRRPEVFGMAASHSGDLYFELCYKPAFARCLPVLERHGGLAGFVERLRDIRPRDPGFHATLNTVAMAACYSPDPAMSPGFVLPFDTHTGELHEAVWQRWLSWDPVHLAERHVKALRSLRLLYLDAGTLDEFNLQYGARIFTQRLRGLGVPFVYEEFVDSHLNIPYRFDRSFRAISEALPDGA